MTVDMQMKHMVELVVVVQVVLVEIKHPPVHHQLILQVE